MEPLTKRQEQILEFIRCTQDTTGTTPSVREICEEFGYRSPNAAQDHITALVRKGYLEQRPGRARSLRVIDHLRERRRPTMDVPLYGAIPAGPADARSQEPLGCVTVDVDSLGVKPSARTFALRVTGDSMIGRHICDGDIVVCEHGLDPRPNDIVAALIDNESTLKTFVKDRQKTYLKAENPRYSKLYPAEELVIQGIVVSVIRPLRNQRG